MKIYTIQQILADGDFCVCANLRTLKLLFASYAKRIESPYETIEVCVHNADGDLLSMLLFKRRDYDKPFYLSNPESTAQENALSAKLLD